MLWGSDWPVVNLAGAYAKWFAAAEALLADLSSVRKGGYLRRQRGARLSREPRATDKLTTILLARARGQAADNVALKENSDNHERGDRSGR
jgi:hypothetical protein